MLVITGRAKKKLREIAGQKAPQGDVSDAAFGVRLVLNSPDNGIQGNKCTIGISQPHIGDLTIDIGGVKLLIDPETMTRLGNMSAILDLAQGCSREDLVLIVEGPNQNHWASG